MRKEKDKVREEKREKYRNTGMCIGAVVENPGPDDRHQAPNLDGGSLFIVLILSLVCIMYNLCN